MHYFSAFLNTNLAYLLGSESTDTGNIRETFFYNQMRVTTDVISSKISDFEIDGKTFEVGGKTIGAAVGTKTPDMNAELPHHLEKTAVSLCLLEAHVTVAVASSSMPRSTVSALGMRVCGRSVKRPSDTG